MIEAYFDGLYQEGIAAYGYVILKDGKEIKTGCNIIDEGEGMTNNVAEYGGLIRVLQRLRTMRLRHEKITVYSDSMLVINQMNWIWRLNAILLIPLNKQARQLAQDMNIEYKWVSRWNYQLSRADVLSRVAFRRYRTGRKGKT